MRGVRRAVEPAVARVDLEAGLGKKRVPPLRLEPPERHRRLLVRSAHREREGLPLEIPVGALVDAGLALDPAAVGLVDVVLRGAEHVEDQPSAVDETDGRWIEREPGIDERADWDLDEQTLTLSVRGAAGATTMRLWWLEPERWLALLGDAGFAVEHVYGWFDRRPYRGGEDTVFVARRS